MEIRGLGVINIQDLFGIAATRTSKRIELVVQLERWEARRDYDRLGLADERYQILNLPLPLIRMPVAPGGTSRSSWRSRRATSCCARAGTTPRASSPSGSSISCSWPAWTSWTNRKSRTCRTPEKSRDCRRPKHPRRRSAPGAFHRAHRAVGLGKIAGHPGARGSRVFLRRQHPDHADPDAGRSGAAARASRAWPSSSTSARRTFWRSFRRRIGSFASMKGSEPGADLSRGHARHAGAALQRDAAAASACARLIGVGRDQGRAQADEHDPVDGRSHHRHVGSDRASAASGVQDVCVLIGRRQRGQKAKLAVTLVSFGFKHGIPMDADLVFDVRFLPNPHFVPRLRPKTGRDRAVVKFMEDIARQASCWPG